MYVNSIHIFILYLSILNLRILLPGAAKRVDPAGGRQIGVAHRENDGGPLGMDGTLHFGNPIYSPEKKVGIFLGVYPLLQGLLGTQKVRKKGL